MSQYAVIGDPVQHSKSPLIHQMFAEQTAQDLHYDAIQVQASALAQFITDFFANGGAGLNVTVPHKETAFALMAVCSDRALLAKATNTIFLDATGNLCGDNTDGVGLVRDIQSNHKFDIRDKRILLLGAGGAVRGALGPLIAEQPASITIANRTVAKAEKLANEFASLLAIETGSFASLTNQKFDLIINGTSMGLIEQTPDIDNRILSDECCCYDMMYSKGDTAFVSWSKNNGAKISIDGLGMLVEQAAEAFAIWRGVRPDTAPVIKALRN